MALSKDQIAELANLPRKDVEGKLLDELMAVSELLDTWLQARDPAAYLDTSSLISLLDGAKGFRADLETCGERIKEEVRSWHKGGPTWAADSEVHHLGFDHIDGS